MSGATFFGYSTSVNTETPTSGLTTVQSIKEKQDTTYYVIATYTKNAGATFYYSTNANGVVGSTTLSGNHERYLYCQNTTTATKPQSRASRKTSER